MRVRFEQQPDKGYGVHAWAVGILGGVHCQRAKTEQLFELIHYHEQVHVLRQARLLNDVNEPEAAQP